MQVYKFGGASIATPQRMTALLPIIKNATQPLLVVVSAYGKTTNALEEIVKDAFSYKREDAIKKIEAIEKAHKDYAKELLKADRLDNLLVEIDVLITEMSWAVEDAETHSYDYVYDQIVSIGELLSTTIFSHYLNQESLTNTWLDVRDVIRTNSDYRDGKVDEEFTKGQMQKIVKPIFDKTNIIVSQGFIGCTDENNSTTLGREGSDYSAALFASMLGAEKVTIWKDVEGLLNADPKLFTKTTKIQEISFYEVIEMAYYGAQVIHPKTIKPLQNNNIPLYVKCFLDESLPGTVIKNEVDEAQYPPIIVLKKNQVLIQITSKDFSFVTENKLSEIYDIFHNCKIKINLLQNAAISLTVLVDEDMDKIMQLIGLLSVDYKVLRNDHLELLTIRHYDNQIFKELSEGREIILEQKSRTTIQAILK